MSSTLPHYTSQQQAAIAARNVSVALSAGAGCGKTFVLTERFLSHLQPGNDGAPPADRLHQLIAITFTDRAAREMRDRIRKTCYLRLQDAPPNQAEYWLTLLRTLDTARVSTIHSFCGALLRTHAVEAQLDPHFVVIEQTQSETLMVELIEDVLREKLSDAKDPLYQQALNLAEKFDLQRLRRMVAELLSSGAVIDFDKWLSRSATDIVDSWAHCHETKVVPAVINQLREAVATKSLLQVLEHLDPAPAAMLAARSVLLSGLPTLSNASDPATHIRELREAAKLPKGGKKVWADVSQCNLFRDTAEAFRKEVDKRIGRLEFDCAAVMADATAGLQLLALAKEVFQRYQSRKAELAWIDFNDLLVRAHRLLTDPAHAQLQQQLASQVRLLLIDECQDTDPLQVDLIRALCGQKVDADNHKLFFVGDYKQSIYRFRGADPNVFYGLQAAIPKAGRLPLTENFRSQPAILDFVNALFCDVLSNGADPALEYQPLVAHRTQVSSLPAVEFLWAVVDEQKKTETGAAEQARQLEAEFIARRIRGMLDCCEQCVAVEQQPGAATRPVELKDIAILFRTLSDVQFYEESLRKYGINYYLVGGHAFYAQQEIYDVVNLLRTLASPADTISLVGVLRSPMFALDDETLFWLAQHQQGLAAGLTANLLPSELTKDQRHRVLFAAQTLQHLRDCKDRLPIAGLLNKALSLTGYDAALLGEFMGERKLANLRKLIEQARAFDQSGALGLADFVVQLSEFVVQMPREPLAATHPEGTNVVRLMTIHQAKGLEFPVVIVSDVGRRFISSEHGAVWDSELGPLVKLPTREEKSKKISGLDLHNVMSGTEDEAEWLRLFYVATTRAKDYLVLSSGLSAKGLETSTAPWMKLLSDRFNLRTGQFTSSLPSNRNYRQPEVKVTLDKPPCESSAHGQARQNLDRLIEQATAQAQGGKRDGAPKPDSQNVHQQLAEPIRVDWAARRRFSVSRLEGHLQLTREASLADTFNAEDDLPAIGAAQAADFGTLVHRALATFPMEAKTKIDIRHLLARSLDGGGDTHADLIDHAVTILQQFMKSDRAAQLAAATQAHRELEFLLAWPPEGNSNSTESGRYLQGFIDCLYQDALGGWHLVDYKTNQVSAANLLNFAGQFEMQLGVYALAVEQIFGQPPVELTVHFLRPSLEHHFRWNVEMRNRVKEEVNQAMKSTVRAV